MIERVLSLLKYFTVYALCACRVANGACPVCALAVGGCVAITRRFGVDDTVIGIWIGALIGSLIGMSISLLNHLGIKFFGRKPLIAIAYITAMMLPLYRRHIIGVPNNTLWGIDKMLFGIVLGLCVFCAGCLTYCFLKQKNGGQAHFPFQKVLVPIGMLLVVSLIMYCITK